ncbi:cyclic nucleotide-binding domain-containing protein 2-like [Ylistrum balloti]|uniref:cyclic nucleotide-binding domain-containing protein 2-like n=1 Tax=Ylistrum balloti TaxID=509963 RepID=UPI002905EC78|nr:cyclic nucleotide-binding domain-containing protein 2-like [Ylistrum balloti]
MASSSRKLSDYTDLLFRKRMQNRALSDSDCTRRFSTYSNSVQPQFRSRHFSIDEESTNPITSYRKTKKSNSIPALKMTDDSLSKSRLNITIPQFSKKKLLKTRSTQNFGLFPPRKVSRQQVVGRPFLRQGRLLRRVRSENNVIPAPPFLNRILPLVRFRRVVKTVQVLLRATLTNRQTHRTDAKYLSWAHDDFSSSKRTYEMFGLSFDPSDYRAKKEVYLSNEAKVILSMDPRDRTDDHLKVALLALNNAVEAFGEFPITMQRSLVRVGWYECFEDKRVIIRQGHMADNFYFILSGTAVVTILETDPETKEQLVRTAALLGKGNSFGELALMHGAKRSATVTCKNSVELLAVGRDDFIDIFMPVEKDQEPEHIRFLRSVILLKGWPIVRLPYHDPKICCFTYFRRGLLLCKDSNTSEWVYVIKTGTCRVLKALQTTRPNIPGLEPNLKKHEKPLKLPPITQSQSLTSPSITPTSSVDFCSPRSPRNSSSEGHIPKKFRKCTTETMANLFSKKSKEERLSTADHKRRIDRVYEKTHASHYRKGKERLPSLRDLESIPSSSELNKQPDTVFVQIQKLGPRETYGLEQVAFGMIGKTTSTILVSEGAECILINRKFFKQYLTDEEAKRIRHTLQPIPSEESLQQKLQDKTNWEAYKALTVVSHLLYKRQEENNASVFY